MDSDLSYYQLSKLVIRSQRRVLCKSISVLKCNRYRKEIQYNWRHGIVKVSKFIHVEFYDKARNWSCFWHISTFLPDRWQMLIKGILWKKLMKTVTLTPKRHYHWLIFGALALIEVCKEYLTPFITGIPSNVYNALIVHFNFVVYGIISWHFISIN